MPEIPAVALSPETGSSCQATQSRTLQRYHKYSVSVNSQYLNYRTMASINLLARASLAMVFARDPRAYAVAGWPYMQARGPEPLSRLHPNWCSSHIWLSIMSSRRSWDDPADETLPTGHHHSNTSLTGYRSWLSRDDKTDRSLGAS